MKTIAKALCDFDDIIIYARSLVANLQVHETIRVYDVFMDGVREAMDQLKYEAPMIRAGKIGEQKKGFYLQDDIKLDDLKYDCFDRDNCASCRHSFILPIGKNSVEILRFNTECKKNILRKWKYGLSSHCLGAD